MRLAQLDAGFARLTADAEIAGRGLRLLRGVELMLDVPDPDVSDERLRLGGGRFVLVEYPGLQLPLAHADFAIRALRQNGWQPVVAHPERYRNVDESLEQLLPLRYAGAYFQVNAGSLTGQHGDGPARRARRAWRGSAGRGAVLRESGAPRPWGVAAAGGTDGWCGAQGAPVVGAVA